MEKVFVKQCDEYDFEKIYTIYQEMLLQNHLLDFVYPGIQIAIKVNLVSASKPETATTTHPILVAALCKLLISMGAKVIVGDSPGGLFNETVLNNIYKKTQIEEVLKYQAALNHNFNMKTIQTSQLKIVKSLDCSEWLLNADAIINFAKMKTHGMMSLSGSVKNMFGSVPGTIKLEYHYKYLSHSDFANMLIDIQEFYKVKLHLMDAIDAMEGNGPTMGVKKHIGLLMASKSPYELDLICAKIMNLNIQQVPTIQEAIKRNLCSKNIDEVKVNKDLSSNVDYTFQNIEHLETIEFYSKDKGIKKIIGKIAKKVLLTRPKVFKKECIGCKKCYSICPAKAIVMKNNKPVINKEICIRCFCCQEFCPVGAMKTHRSFIAKILVKRKKNG